jgi:hypothetical protein
MNVIVELNLRYFDKHLIFMSLLFTIYMIRIKFVSFLNP